MLSGFEGGGIRGCCTREYQRYDAASLFHDSYEGGARDSTRAVVCMNLESPCPNTLASRATFLIVCTLPGRRYSTTHRPALERAACECCAIIKSEYDRVLGPENLG
jgi:hypothetical protein